MSIEQLTLFQTVCDLVHLGHGEDSGNPVGTLNRLFIKNLTGNNKYEAVNPPYLDEDKVIIKIERWDKEELWKLAPRTNSKLPRFTEFPVVIVRYKGKNYLIDGNARANFWKQIGDFGEYSAYIVAVNE